MFLVKLLRNYIFLGLMLLPCAAAASIITFNYSPGALYGVYCAPLNITDIQFQNKEHLIAIAAGDTVRWQVSKTFSGLGEERTEHLLIKPTEANLNTTLVVTTDVRTYHIILYSKEKTYMPIVNWHYFDNKSASEEKTDTKNPEAPNIDYDHLDFSYQAKLVRGKKPEWFPVAIFNDGNKTFIRLPRKIQDAPILSIGTNENNGQVINYRVVGSYYVADSLFPAALLYGGQNNQTIVQISYMIKKNRYAK